MPGKKIKPFKEPIYVTRPLLPDIDDFKGKIKEIWDSKWLTNCGHQHELLEEKLRKHLQVPYLSLFNNGTIALIVAIQAMELSGEVITTPFTFPATPHVLKWNGLTPVFCDIDERTMCIDVKKIKKSITSKTSAILGVHVYGTPCDVSGINKLAKEYGLKVIYDAAHAFGVSINNRSIGTFGDISMFSFHATKLFHTAEGGALAYSDKRLKDKVYYLKNFGIKNENEVVMPGINGKMNEIQAGLGLLVLDKVKAETERRKKIRARYIECLKDTEGVEFTPIEKGVTSSYQYLAVRIKEKVFGASRDFLNKYLREHNVITRKYFYPLCSEYACYRDLPSSAASNLKNAHKAAEESLTLPFYGGLKDPDVEHICSIIKSARNA
jgi:dTDP-4-amino-4,6-dideoxygalactose transaminase